MKLQNTNDKSKINILIFYLWTGNTQNIHDKNIKYFKFLPPRTTLLIFHRHQHQHQHHLYLQLLSSHLFIFMLDTRILPLNHQHVHQIDHYSFKHHCHYHQLPHLQNHYPNDPISPWQKTRNNSNPVGHP